MADENKTPTIEEQLKEAVAKIAELEEMVKKQKAAIDNACADASQQKKAAQEWQDKYKATLSEQEQKELEAKQREEQMASELNTLKAEKRTAEYSKKLMEIGFDAQAATEMALSLPEGVADSFFEGQKKFLETKTQEIKTQSLNAQPGLTVGTTPTAADADAAENAKMRKWFGLPEK